MEKDETKTARDVIDRDLRQLKTLLATNRFDKVKYQSDGKGGLGSGALRVGDEVKTHITLDLSLWLCRCVALALSLCRTGSVAVSNWLCRSGALAIVWLCRSVALSLSLCRSVSVALSLWLCRSVSVDLSLSLSLSLCRPTTLEIIYTRLFFCVVMAESSTRCFG